MVLYGSDRCFLRVLVGQRHRSLLASRDQHLAHGCQVFHSYRLVFQQPRVIALCFQGTRVLACHRGFVTCGTIEIACAFLLPISLANFCALLVHR